MIPFKKLASLFVRTFSKPLSNIIKRYALNNTANKSAGRRIVRNTFIFLGNKYNILDVYLDRSAMGQSQQSMFIKPLADEAAFLKGTDFFADFFIYFCVLGIPLLEITRQSQEAEKKQKIQDKKLETIANEIETLQQIQEKIKQLQNKIDVLDNQILQKLKQTSEHFSESIQNEGKTD